MDVIRDEIVTIRKRGAEDEITALSVTPGQYREILKKYGTRKSVRKSNGDCFETYRRAQEAALPGEEILRHYRSSPLTEGFEGAVVSFARLFQMMQDAMLKHKKFRAVIDYDAELTRTEISIYTPKGSGGDADFPEA